jgi:HD-GYP domain-containing protein (c-di-GMP phosphodiesterase class II)
VSSQPPGDASRRTIRLITVLGVVVFGLSWFLARPAAADWIPLVVFTAMVCLAEWLPVPIGQSGVMVSVSTPIIAAVATLYGPAAACTMDWACTSVAGAVYLGLPALRKKWLWPLFNGAQAALSAGAAGTAAMLIKPWRPDSLGLAVAALAATLVYILVNSFLVAYVESVISAGSVWTKLDEKRKAIGLQYFAYAVLAVAVVMLADNNQLWACALFFVPMWAARQCFQLRARYLRDYRETIRALGLMMQHAHPYTGGHQDRVARFAMRTAQRLGLPQQDVDLMFDAALLHDLGKIAVNEAVLNRAGPLTEEEWREVRRHPDIGGQILRQVSMLEPVVPWITAHHERPDGEGYPSGVDGEEIPIQARIIAVVDAFDAMVRRDDPMERRPYRVSMSVDQALQELHACAGTQFDERVVMAFAQVVREEGAA